MTKSKKKSGMPKPRNVWEINPKTRVKPSEKVYKRQAEKKKAKSWIENICWFGEVKK